MFFSACFTLFIRHNCLPQEQENGLRINKNSELFIFHTHFTPE